MKYFSVVFFSFFIPLCSIANEYEENHYFPLHSATSANKIDGLSGELNFKIRLMYSPCVILEEKYGRDLFSIKLEQCLLNNKNIKIPLHAKAKLIENSNKVIISHDINYQLYSGINIVYLQTKKIKGSSAIMELSYD